jgi:transcriptional regulator with XRE-family HTH domain
LAISCVRGESAAALASALACDAEISQRHLSFVESGRASPSREMIVHLAQQLDVPLRDRNLLLVAVGFAPMYRERPLDDPALQAARKALGVVVKGHEPYPALAVDRHWTLVAANRAISPLLTGADPELLQPPVNVLRLSLHPAGLAPRIVNLEQWGEHILARLNRQVEVAADRVLAEIYTNLSVLSVRFRLVFNRKIAIPTSASVPRKRSGFDPSLNFPVFQ